MNANVNAKSLLKLGLTTLVFASATVTGLSEISQAGFVPRFDKSDRSEVRVAQSTALMSGEFVAAEAPTTNIYLSFIPIVYGGQDAKRADPASITDTTESSTCARDTRRFPPQV